MIDYREDKSADTGQFELCYKQRMPSCQPYLGAALSLQGTKITAGERKPNSSPQDSKFNLMSKLPMVRSVSVIVYLSLRSIRKFLIIVDEPIAEKVDSAQPHWSSYCRPD